MGSFACGGIAYSTLVLGTCGCSCEVGTAGFRLGFLGPFIGVVVDYYLRGGVYSFVFLRVLCFFVALFLRLFWLF